MQRLAPRSGITVSALTVGALALLGCGANQRSTSAGPYQAVRATPAAPGSYEDSRETQASAPPPAPRKAAEAASDRAYQHAPEEHRPGLGTEWGESRESRVSTAPFDRESFDSPVSVTSFYYNDERGVRAMLGSAPDYGARRSDGVSAAHGAITVRLVDGSGVPLPTYSSGGRSYVVGDDGSRYSIRIDNQTGARFEAVATVDGLDVIDGQPGGFEKRGYLVNPWSSVEIDGFRRSDDEVAAFRFGRVRDSYAAKRGNDRNVGVIGVAVFQERGSAYPWHGRELQKRHDADPFPGRFAPPPPGY